ncbi:hypothetical protein NE237_006847 [Protea cynaroides]|uniref:Poor homologous synapsis 1 PH domain-containing protein n=1 Tax=Protea cynaroides TaxID=273540 RepID=A0A9Q0KN75_9MAGN|nr:hypothetical protein NE237_006847 [Protea cynaroides]
MAGVLLPAETGNVATSLTAIEGQWEVEFARFFNFPSIPLPSTSLALKSIRKSTIDRLRGTWLSSSSTASLQLLTCHSSPELVLVVSLQGKIHEEHFVSTLHFSWPQVSCVYQCLARGSRVVFASYRDSVGQIQKFALRFSASSEAKSFINVLKGRLENMINIVCPQNNIKSELFSSNELQCRVLEDASDVSSDVICVNSALTYSPQMLPWDCKAAEETTCLQEPAPANNFESISSALPPSFTALLASCCSEGEQDQPKVPEEVDMMTQITRCMLDPSFNDMLIKVEKAITEMGGDLAI